MAKCNCRPVAGLVALAALAGTAALLFAPTPAEWLGLWRSQLLDFGHVPLFAALVLALRLWTGPPLWRPLLVAVVFAGLAEIIQPSFGRTCDWLDFVRGVLGALAAAAVVRAWAARSARVRAAAYLVLAFLLTLGPVIEVAPYVADTVDSRRTFPVLAQFSTDHEFRRWACVQATLTRDAGGGRVEFLTGPDTYSVAALRPGVSNFSGYQWLCYEFEVVGASVDLAASVRTGMHGGGATAHADVVGRYASGLHTVRLELAALSARGSPEPLEMSDVRAIILFVIRPREARTIVLTRVWLEH